MVKKSASYRIATIKIPRTTFTEEEAIDFIKNHFTYKKMRLQKAFFLFRQNTPAYLKSLGFSDYRTKVLPNGVHVVIAYHTSLDGGDVSVDELGKFVDSGYAKPENMAEDINGYKLDKQLSTPENQVYHNDQTGKTLMNLRGTEPTFKDWGNNALAAVGLYKHTDRYKRAKHTKEEAIKKYGKIEDVTAHSQGSFSGTEFAKDKNVGSVVHLNPAPIRLKAKEHVVRGKHDIVSLPTAIMNYGNKNITTVANKLPTLNPSNLAKYLIGQHSTKILGSLNPFKRIG